MLPSMCPELVVCPNSTCGASGCIGVHLRKELLYICHGCKTTFADMTGALLFDTTERFDKMFPSTTPTLNEWIVLINQDSELAKQHLEWLQSQIKQEGV